MASLQAARSDTCKVRDARRGANAVQPLTGGQRKAPSIELPLNVAEWALDCREVDPNAGEWAIDSREEDSDAGHPRLEAVIEAGSSWIE